MDWVPAALLLKPYRCTQCLQRFFRFRSSRARRAVMATLCLIPLMVLVAWFVELYSLDRLRSRNAPDPPKSNLARPDVDEILKMR
jgi:hypothetical protein